jgi:4-phytase / acid phosphatase
MNLKKLEALMLAALALGSGAAVVSAQEAPARGTELKFVVILSRHGVRSPTWKTDRLNQYSTEAWPDWGVPPGYLTPHGKALMELFGAYDRAYLSHEGLLSVKGCEDARRLFLWADTDQRTIETGRALAAGMFPDCAVQTQSLPEGTADPLFSPLAVGIGHPDRALAVASVLGRIGASPAPLLEAHKPAFETMQQVLLGCTPGAKCPPDGTSVKQSFLEETMSVTQGKGDKLVDFGGPLNTAASFAEDFLLEYTNGMADKALGWGRVNESNLRQMMSLHTAFSDLLRRTPCLARTNGSNLVSHMLKSMEQAVAGKPVPGALGKPGDKVVVIVGHDGNLSNLSGMLGLSWLIESYQPDDTPPGGALVFELWRHPVTGAYTVRTYYTAQTLEQMRKSLPLTLTSPPAKAAVFVPGCSTADEGLACGWKEFRRTLESAIDPAFVRP